MAWVLTLDKPREWPAGAMLSELALNDPTLARMRGLPAIEQVRNFADGSSTYAIDWAAVETWLAALIVDPVQKPVLGMLTPAEADWAKDQLLGFFTSAGGAKPRSAPPTTSASEPASATIRID
jgi:hypothetical protein